MSFDKIQDHADDQLDATASDSIGADYQKLVNRFQRLINAMNAANIEFTPEMADIINDSVEDEEEAFLEDPIVEEFLNQAADLLDLPQCIEIAKQLLCAVQSELLDLVQEPETSTDEHIQVASNLTRLDVAVQQLIEVDLDFYDEDEDEDESEDEDEE